MTYIEQEGIKRAYTEINNADVVLLVFDTKDNSPDFSILPDLVKDKPKICIRNKIDLSNAKSEVRKLGKTIGG